jgi:hypothetical protein
MKPLLRSSLIALMLLGGYAGLAASSTTQHIPGLPTPQPPAQHIPGLPTPQPPAQHIPGLPTPQPPAR